MAKLGTAPKKLSIFIGAVLFFSFIANLAYAALPTVGTISPSSGTTPPNIAKTFTTTYSDTDGWTNIKEVYLLISTSSTVLANSVYLYYDQNTNLLYVRNDANTAWLGGYAPATSNTIENSYVKLNCLNTSITNSTTTLTIKWNITFKSAYSGKTYSTYLKVVDDTGGYVNWSRKGTYIVNISPAVGTITPSSGRGPVETPQVFTTTYSDPDGWQNIQYAYFLINTSTDTDTDTSTDTYTYTHTDTRTETDTYTYTDTDTSTYPPNGGSNCFYAYYNQNTNKLYLRNDTDSAWLGGYRPGSNYTIENSYAKIDCSKTTTSGSGAILTVKWSITFKPKFLGAKYTYLYVTDDANAYDGWVQKGTWTITNQVLSISINPKIWDVGQTEINKTITMTRTNKITVTNNGTSSETFELTLTNPTGWTASTLPGQNTYVLSGLFCNSSDIPQENHFNQDNVNEDIITTQVKKATSTIFGYTQATANGVGVPSGQSRALYLQFKSPTITDKTNEQDISVIVSCQMS